MYHRFVAALPWLLLLSTPAFCAGPVDGYLSAARMAESSGLWLEVRNDLSRALAWDRLDRSLTDNERDDLARRLAEATDRWRATLPPPAAATPLVTSVDTDVPPVETKRPNARTSSGHRHRRERASVTEIVRKADAARAAGRYETALRLYSAAAKLPGGDAAAVAADAIRGEIGTQDGR